MQSCIARHIGLPTCLLPIPTISALRPCKYREARGGHFDRRGRRKETANPIHSIHLTSASRDGRTAAIVSANHRALPTAKKGVRDDVSRIPSLPAQTRRRARTEERRPSVEDLAKWLPRPRNRSGPGRGAANYSNRRVASSQYQNKNRTLVRDNVRRDLGLERLSAQKRESDGRTDGDRPPDPPRW